jgi:uncharacterized membrane protein
MSSPRLGVPRELLLNVSRGFAMGAADLVPGVSGGTVALVLGIYERLIASIRAGSRGLGNLLVLIGLMAGSVRVLWPWPEGVESTELGPPDGAVLLAVLAAGVSFVAVVIIAGAALRLERAEEAALTDVAPSPGHSGPTDESPRSNPTWQ